MKIKILLLTLSIASCSTFANDVSFSIGGGYPYLVIPEVSLSANDDTQRWYANYKLGLDDGFSAGFEQAVSDNKKHAFGVLVGAIGARDTDQECESSTNDVATDFANTLGCVIGGIFDEETTNGIGLTYNYNFNGLNSAGFRLKLDVGYGKASDSNEKRADGGISVSYEF
ncbi:hypothetical protein H5089_06815 [Pseudoalteromonas sp. SR45-1]|uniref:hypothetical protein n=1 Tax=unclassified Pseudoalteromonas TaxID=194690 RepID=UPI0015F7C1B0|nr:MULTISPECIES: hypothetical protein [unclassified Pseudoalteromonas]MBB1305353.1 hypothetical protein [Pseudoalteromonas sp. SR43-5]MBB1325225.1 hypothetical protein [Pseudoalteromonas sp. SR45-1]